MEARRKMKAQKMSKREKLTKACRKAASDPRLPKELRDRIRRSELSKNRSELMKLSRLKSQDEQREVADGFLPIADRLRRAVLRALPRDERLAGGRHQRLGGTDGRLDDGAPPALALLDALRLRLLIDPLLLYNFLF